MAVTTTWLNAYDAEFCGLIAQLDALQNRLYPAEFNHLDPPSELAQAHVQIRGAYAQSKLIGCCALKHGADYGELKRLYVCPHNRGQGVAQRLVHELEQHAKAHGLGWLRLETGVYQPEAQALYKRLGFVEIGPFGNYVANPYSVFYGKAIC